MRKILLFLGIFLFALNAKSQVYLDNVIDDESDLYAQTKQINQFFRRFNAEENKKGKRLYDGDRNFRNPELREKYLENLFDFQNTNISSSLKNKFITSVNSKNNAEYIDFYQPNWYAELDASFLYKGKEVSLIMYMKIEKDRLGYKWVISNVHFNQFEELFFPDTTGTTAPQFIHPMSHEVNFMTLKKIFDRTRDIEYYCKKDYEPDYLTLFIYEIKKGNLKYQVVNNLKFHFLQLDNWYFEVQFFNRKGFNTGWLISNLLPVTDENKKNFKF